MKLAPRLVAVTAGTVFLASSLVGWLQLRMERNQLLADERAESRILVRSLQVSVENALRDGQDPDITELLTRLEALDRQVDVLVFSRGATEPRQASVGSVPDDPRLQQVRQRAHAGEEVYELIEDDPPRLIAGAPLRTDAGAGIGSLIVSRPLTSLAADIRDTTRLVGLAVFVFAGATTLVMLLLLRREVSGPLSQLARSAASLGQVLEAPLSLPQAHSDELEALGTALTELQEHLIRARDARDREAEQRELLERKLREADKLIAVGQLASGLAHEIGSPLQVLVGRARLLATDDTASDAVRRQAGAIGEQAARIATIVGRLQDVARRRPTRLERVDLRGPVEKVMWLLGPETTRRGQVLEWSTAPGPVWVKADPDEVQQVALNLVLNALDANPKGGRVRVRVDALGDDGVLDVRDDGEGMSEAVRAQAFEPFFTTRADEGGTGLGLAVVQSIANRHRAKITIQPGSGTWLRIVWPGEPA